MKTAITRALSLLLVCMFVLGMGIMSYAADDAIPGDINNDGELTIIDVLFIVKAVANNTAIENSDVNGDGNTNLLDVINIIRLIATGEAPEVGEEDKSSADIVVEDGVVKEAVSINGDNVSAAVPEGVAVEEGTTELTLSVTAMDDTNGNIKTDEDEEAVSYDVHVDGVSEENTVAIIVDLGAILPAGQNMGTVVLYHVENGDTVKMTQVASLDELDEHNEFYYYPATGNVYVAMATFSEVTAVVNSVNPWKGEIDYTWFTENPSANEFFIANADQLAGFARLVGGMAKDDKGNWIYTDTDGHWCTFNGKTVTLTSDINLDDTTDENNNKVFYPIGYWNSTGSFEKKAGGSVSSSVYSFEGTFDGAGHTIANFYQNTWEMFGDYNDGYSGTPNHYKDGMGLFGYVYGGTVKNLTVKKFQSDGEFTPTGVIAAYACNATFENIAIVECNPRVYNTGNGGIVGIGGNDDDLENYKLTFNNITIDSTNKITALWGSWDVACGGLVGMFRGKGEVYMNSCHVAAQIDVYNDVCGNYQYYWYRYAGMLIGTNKNMITDKNGYTVPETSKYHATNCTVHFDTWNDYYYCELVANSLASYTHDHQFSRLEVIDNVDSIRETNGDWSKAGNFIVLGKNGKNTCYHIVNKDGKLVQHNHKDAGTEVVDGETVLKEDKQCVYLPFNQLFTGYGWGVKNIPIYDDGTPNPFEGVTVRGRESSTSILKFTGSDKTYTDGMTVKASDLFAVKSNLKIALDKDNVIVSVTPAANSMASATVTKGDTWENTTIKFAGTGNLMIAIQDYYFCTPTIINVTLLDKDHYHIDADGTSKLAWKKDGSNYKLVCNNDGCGALLETTTKKPVVYLDHADDVDGTSDFSLGIDKDYPVRTLAEASARVAETGGTIKLTSDIEAGSTGINNPKDFYEAGVPNKMTPWKETVTFNGDVDDNGVADYGFDIANHGSSIYFDGPTVLEYLVIGYSFENGEKPNYSDGGYYNIGVFVGKWNDFTFGEGIVAHSPFYFIVGDYFYRTSDLSDNTDTRLFIQYYYQNKYNNLTWDTPSLNYTADGNRYTSDLAVNGKQKVVNIEFNKIDCDATCPVKDKDGNVIGIVSVEAYDRIYLGTRNRTYDSLTVKNAHVNVTSNDAAFNFVYAGSTSGSYKVDKDGNKVDGTQEDEALGTELHVVDTQMVNCSLDIDFNGSKDADAYLRLFRVGNSNAGAHGTAYLDKLELALDGTFYTKETPADKNKDSGVVTSKFFTVGRVVDADVTVSNGAYRTRSSDEIAYNEMSMTFKLYDKDSDHKHTLYITYGTHSFAKDRTIYHSTYANSDVNIDIKNDCVGDWKVDASNPTQETRTCTICGAVETLPSTNTAHTHTDTYITGSSGEYVLNCATCGVVSMKDKPEEADKLPVIYVDVKNTSGKASDKNLGFDKDNAVKTLGTAVTRLKETGGTIKLVSTVEVGDGSVNHPHGSNHLLPDWDKEITFSGILSDSEPTTGFKFNSHGAQVYFNGPAKLKNILIDGRRDSLNTQSDVDAYYTIGVFVSNWYDFTVDTGVVAYGGHYFIIGNYFTSNHTLSEYKGKHVPFFSGDDTNGYVSNPDRTTKVELAPITEKPVKLKSGEESAVTAYRIVFLGNRDTTTDKTESMADTCTTKNAKIELTVTGATTIAKIYAGSYDSTSTANYTYNPVKDSEITIDLYGSTKVESLAMGTNFKKGTAYLDTLKIKLNNNAHFDCGNANSKVVDIYNAKNVTFYANATNRDSNSGTNVGRIVFDKSAKYNAGAGTFRSRFGVHDFKLYDAQGSYADYGFPVFDEELYTGSNQYFLMKDECTYDDKDVTKACTCGKTKTMTAEYRRYMGTFKNIKDDDFDF